MTNLYLVITIMLVPLPQGTINNHIIQLMNTLPQVGNESDCWNCLYHCQTLVNTIRPLGARECPKAQVQPKWEKEAIVITLRLTIKPDVGFNVNAAQYKQI